MTRYVLIVEDNPIASKIQKMIMEHLKFDVDCAMTGEEGMDLACKKKYDLILMDLGLPGIDGIETTKRIKSILSSTKNTLTPIVAVTANEDSIIRERCIQAGMDDVISKPFTSIAAKELLARFCTE